MIGFGHTDFAPATEGHLEESSHLTKSEFSQKRKGGAMGGLEEINVGWETNSTWMAIYRRHI